MELQTKVLICPCFPALLFLHMARINFSFSSDENKVLTNKIVENVSSLNPSFDTSVIRGMLYVLVC